MNKVTPSIWRFLLVESDGRLVILICSSFVRQESPLNWSFHVRVYVETCATWYHSQTRKKQNVFISQNKNWYDLWYNKKGLNFFFFLYQFVFMVVFAWRFEFELIMLFSLVVITFHKIVYRCSFLLFFLMILYSCFHMFHFWHSIVSSSFFLFFLSACK